MSKLLTIIAEAQIHDDAMGTAILGLKSGYTTEGYAKIETTRKFFLGMKNGPVSIFDGIKKLRVTYLQGEKQVKRIHRDGKELLELYREGKTDQAVSNLLENLVSTDAERNSFTKNKKRLARTFISKSFSEVENRNVPVFEGFNLTLIDGIREIRPGMAHVFSESMTILKDFEDTLEDFMLSSDFRQSFSSNSRLSSDVGQITGMMMSKISAMVSENDGSSDHKKVNKLSRNKTELMEVFDEIEKILNYTPKRFTRKLTEKFSDIEEKLNMINVLVEEEDITVTKNTLEAFAIDINTMAEYITMIGVTLFMFKQIKGMALKTKEIIEA